MILRELWAIIKTLPLEHLVSLKKKLEGQDFALHSPEQFAKLTGIPVAKVRRWLREGHIKGKKVSRSWLIPHSEVFKILENRRSDATHPSS